MAEKKFGWWLMSLAFAIGLLAGGGIVYFLTSGKKGGNTVSLYPPKAKEIAGKDWLVKIDDYVITKEEFETGYQILLSEIPESQRLNLPDENILKAQYLDTLQSEYVLTITALKEGLHKTPEANVLINSAIRGAIYRLYLKKNSPKDVSVFKPTKVEIEEYYMRNKSQFEKLGWKADQIKRYAEQDIAQKKIQEWVARFVLSKKEEFKIEKNKKLLEKLGISDVTSSQLIPNLPRTE